MQYCVVCSYVVDVPPPPQMFDTPTVEAVRGPVRCRYKYIHMEEMLGNVAGARQVFERWMKWEPDHNGWAAYIKVSGAVIIEKLA